MSKHLIPAITLALLIGCPAADITPEAVVIADADDVDFEFEMVSLALDESRIDDQEAAAEARPPVVATGSDLLQREGIPHHDPRFHDHFEEAMLLIEEGSPGDAVDALRLAVFDAPDSAVTWQALGETYASLNRTHQARACVEEALVHDRDLPAARAFLAAFWLDRGEPDQARPHAERYARLAPEDAAASHLLARTWMGLQMWSEAIDTSRRTISRDPQFIEAYNALGFSALQVGRNGLALQYLEAATELDGLEPHILNNLGIAYERVDRHVDALQVYADAVAMNPAYSTGRVNRDRVREIVDRQVADEVSRILAARARDGDRPDSTASADSIPTD
jgi:tetratricopeptide (TPR) repeat protein